MSSIVVPALSACLGGAATAWLLLNKRARPAAISIMNNAHSNSCTTHTNPKVGCPARLVPMPHPDWLPGQKQPTPFPADVWTEYDPDKEDKAAVYTLGISVFVPRPIALVSSCSSDGSVNLAPYSYFNTMGHNPVTVCIGINRSPIRNGGKKDTLMNIEDTGEFVINIMSDWFVESAHHSSGDYETGVDELALSGLTPLESKLVRPPRLKESAIHMECKLREVYNIKSAAGQPSIAIVIGEVVLYHIHEGVQGKSPTGKLVVDPIKLQPVSRLGGTMYGRVTELFDIGRPGMADMHKGPAQYTKPFQG